MWTGQPVTRQDMWMDGKWIQCLPSLSQASVSVSHTHTVTDYDSVCLCLSARLVGLLCPFSFSLHHCFHSTVLSFNPTCQSHLKGACLQRWETIEVTVREGPWVPWVMACSRQGLFWWREVFVCFYTDTTEGTDTMFVMPSMSSVRLTVCLTLFHSSSLIELQAVS